MARKVSFGPVDAAHLQHSGDGVQKRAALMVHSEDGGDMSQTFTARHGSARTGHEVKL